MYVCVCKGITDSQIIQAVENGAANYAHVREALGIASCCGLCAKETKALVKNTAAKVAYKNTLEATQRAANLGYEVMFA